MDHTREREEQNNRYRNEVLEENKRYKIRNVVFMEQLIDLVRTIEMFDSSDELKEKD